MPGHQDLVVVSAEGQSRAERSDQRAFLSYRCGHCGEVNNGAVIAWNKTDFELGQWLMCTNCGQGSVRFHDGAISPATLGGPGVQGLPSEVDKAYREARRSHGVGAYTGCELVCRKILMHVAVDVANAAAGQSFVKYIDELEQAGYVTPPMKPWVDLIRKHANEAAHDLPAIDEQRALGTLTFTGELLRLTYEMDYLAKTFTSPAPQTTT